MAKGDPQLSPWVVDFPDYLNRKVTISVAFNNTTRALTSATVSRDDECLWHTIVFDNPSDGARAKRLPAPIDGALDRVYTALQMALQGLNTIEDAMGVQITAEP